jgi:hypothetical protein
MNKKATLNKPNGSRKTNCHRENGNCRVSNNEEAVYQMRAVFPDGSNLYNWNGGCEGRSHVIKLTLEWMMQEFDRREATLVNRQTTKNRGDYHRHNVIMAFQMQFP